MNTNIKRLLAGVLLLIGLVSTALAGWVPTPAVDHNGRIIYIWSGSGQNGNPPIYSIDPNASPSNPAAPDSLPPGAGSGPGGNSPGNQPGNAPGPSTPYHPWDEAQY